MATILIEGFDRYGPGQQATAEASSLLAQGGWSFTGGGILIRPGLNGYSGSCVEMGTSVSPNYQGLGRGLQGNYATIIGGCRISANLDSYFGIQFWDANVVQCQIVVTNASGTIQFTKGDMTYWFFPWTATVLTSSGASIPANSPHYLEWVVNFGMSASYTVWLDGVQIIFGIGQTQQSANPQCNFIQFISPGAGLGVFPGTLAAIDDLYLFDTTTTHNNAVLLSNPIVFTDFPLADHQKQFTNGGNVVGNYFSVGPITANTFNFSANYSIGPNNLYLIPIKPNVNCTLNSLTAGVAYAGSSNAGANFTGVIYSDNAGNPGTLLASGAQVTGFTLGQPFTMPVSYGLVAGTQYWIGFINDSQVNPQNYTAFDPARQNSSPVVTNGQVVTNTYTSGPPGLAPAMSKLQPAICLYGSCTGSATNWPSMSVNPPIGNPSSVSALTVGIEDLYQMPGLNPVVGTVYTVAVSGNAYLTGPGTRGISLDALSGSTDGNGSRTNIPLTTSPTWCDSYFDVDPATGNPWTPTAVSNGYYGMKIAS